MTLEGWPYVARLAMSVEPWTWKLGRSEAAKGRSWVLRRSALDGFLLESYIL